MSIPKIVHQIWIQGYQALPDKFKRNHEIIKKYNPDYQVLLWNELTINPLLIKYPQIYSLYHRIDKLTGLVAVYPSKSDVARMVILREFGGFYIDIDYFCPLSLDEIYQPSDQIVTVSTEYLILRNYPLDYRPKYGACFIGIIPQHPLFDSLFKLLEEQNDRDKIGVLFDKFLQQNHYPVRIIDPRYVSSHTSCQKGICYAPTKSSSVSGRTLLTKLGCPKTFRVIVAISLIIIVVISFYHLRN